ncbi:MAG: acyl-CoA dehydrogenase family protein [Chloroflexi bacterium]|nr:acyl-CoA dehydrogenase family protein [Chloroflexota bacterium]
MTDVAIDPTTEAARLTAEFRQTAAARDLAAGTPKAERDRIRVSGLLKLMIPVAFGGLGATWPDLLRIVREIASADASLAHLFAYHHLGLVTPHLMGTPAQRAHWYTLTARDNLFWGNSLNPLDPRTILTRSPDGRLCLNGEKSFCSGAQDSDLLLVSASELGQAGLRVAVLPTRREGITVHADWDNMGQRQTDSGSVSYRDVVVNEDDFLGPPGAGGSIWAGLRPCVTQSILSTIFVGIARGAFDEARAYTRALERPMAASQAAQPAEDPYILERYGEMQVQLRAAECLLDAAAQALQCAWQRQESLSAEERGICAVAVATAKVAAGRCALEVTSAIFEVMGARATSSRYRFDRFWRNARTLTLHDPLDYKVREVGDWALNGRWPTPSFYS